MKGPCFRQCQPCGDSIDQVTDDDQGYRIEYDHAEVLDRPPALRNRKELDRVLGILDKLKRERGGEVSSWVALHRSRESDELQEKYPLAFLLLCLIARRARYRPCPITGQGVGDALIGDYEKAGISSEGEYRHAKKILEKAKFATFRGTSRGTIATLIESAVFTLSTPSNNGQDNGRTADEQRLTYKDTTDTPPTRDFDSAPDGAAVPIKLTLAQAKALAREIGQNERRNPDNPFALFSGNQIESWAEAWFHKTVATGWLLDRRRIVDPASLLKAYLMQWAINKGRTRPEMESASPCEFDDIPF